MTMDMNHIEAGHSIVQDRTPDVAAKLTTATIEVGLSAAIVSVHNDEPEVLVVRGVTNGKTIHDSLPYGPFSPINHRTLETRTSRQSRPTTTIDVVAETMATSGVAM